MEIPPQMPPSGPQFPPAMPRGGWPGAGGNQSRGCLASLGCLLGLSILFNLVLLLAMGAMSDKGHQAGGVDEHVISGRGKSKIAVIRMVGTILDGNDSYRESASASTVIAKLERARKDPLVRGILIVVNSPGGTVTASDKIHHALLRVKKSKKPVVVVMGDICASGCVYATASASKIFAHPTSMTGSIGVIFSTLNFSKLLETHGVQGVTIASKSNKALLSPFHPVQEEHKQILKAIVDELYARFADIVAKWRKIPKEKLAVFADGRVFSATLAKKYGLIDEIGYQSDAKRAVLKLAGISRARFVRYQRPFGLASLLRGYAQLPVRLEASMKRPSIEEFLRFASPKAYYLWAPASK